MSWENFSGCWWKIALTTKVPSACIAVFQTGRLSEVGSSSELPEPVPAQCPASVFSWGVCAWHKGGLLVNYDGWFLRALLFMQSQTWPYQGWVLQLVALHFCWCLYCEGYLPGGNISLLFFTTEKRSPTPRLCLTTVPVLSYDLLRMLGALAHEIPNFALP